MQRGGGREIKRTEAVKEKAYTGGGGGRQVIEEEEEERRGYGGDVRNINRGPGLPAGAHSAPNTH